jgi:hypothetical protein
MPHADRLPFAWFLHDQAPNYRTVIVRENHQLSDTMGCAQSIWCGWYFTRHKILSYQDKNSSKVSKANTAVTNIPSSVSVPQEDVTENPEFNTYVSFVPIIVIRGQLITSELLTRGCSSKASSRAIGYGPEDKRITGNLDFLPSNINGDGSIEVTRDCEREIKYCCDG